MHSNKKKRAKLLILSVTILFALLLYAFLTQAATTMLSEVVSANSDSDSRYPVIAIGADDIYKIHVAWEDDTEFNISETTRFIQNGPDKDIVYVHKNRTEWSAAAELSGGKLTGGMQVVSNASITSSQNPDIVVDYNNITHIVWQGITRPDELTADANTTFLMHFDNPASSNADYAAGDAPPIESTGITSSPNSIYNRSVLVDSADKLFYNASNNMNLSKGTIEFWYNPQHWSRSNNFYRLFGGWNSTDRRFVINYVDYDASSFAATFRHNSSYMLTLAYSPSYEIKENEWHHIALTYDFDAGDCRLYVDGFLGAVNSSCQRTPFGISNFSVGMSEIPTGYDTSDGMIDELRISDVVRSADEIRNSAGQRDIFHRSLNGTTWSDQSVITSDDNNNSYFPRIDVDKNNTLHLVWNSYHNQSFTTVNYKQKGLSGTWSGAEVVSNLTETYFPDIAVDDYNSSHVVWQSADIYVSTHDFTGFSIIKYSKRNYTDWSVIENVSNRTYETFGINTTRDLAGYVFSTPRIAIGAENTTHIVWATQAGFPDKDLLFYVSFDDMSANVTFANGSTLSHQNASYPGAPGRKDNSDLINTGYAAHVNGSGFINYSAANNFNYEYGTVMMWVSPEWDPGSAYPGRLNSIFTYYSSNATESDIDEYISIYIKQCTGGAECRDAGSTLLTFHIYDNTSTDNVIFYNVTDWEADEWHHLAATWNLSGGTNATKLYIDGQKVEAMIYPDNKDKIYFNDTPTEIIIGNSFNESADKYSYAFNGSIDEVMVFGRILTMPEIDSCRVRDMDIVYRQKNDSGWQEHELVSQSSFDISILPSVAAKDNQVYVVWLGSSSSYDYYSKTYPYGAYYRIAMNTRNVTWKGLKAVNDESTKEAYSTDVKAERPGKVDIVWEDNTIIGGSGIDILYREFTNTTSPNVQMTYPVGGEIINDTFNVNATATDVDSAIANVSFYYTIDDGVSGGLICTDTTGDNNKYSCAWTVGMMAEDIYKVKAIATSNDGGKNWSTSDYIYLDTSIGIVLYTFNLTGNSLGDHTIYSKGWRESNETDARPDVDDPGTLGTDVTSTARANVSSPDNQRYKVHWTSSCGIYNITNAIIFKFYIDEAVADISNIRVHWKGYGYDTDGYLTNLSLWNFDTSSWELMVYKDFVEELDDDLSYSMTSGFSSYLDSVNNTMYILAETDDRIYDPCGWGGIVICPLYLSWNGTQYEFETEGILGILDRRLEMPTYDRLYNVKPANKTIRAAIAEIVDETTYMDAAELITVDHGKDADVMLDFDGIPHTIKNPGNVVCKDRFGNDCTSLIEAEDEKPKNAESSLEHGLVGSRSLFDPVLTNGPEGNYWVSNLSALDLGSMKDRRDYIEITLPELPEPDREDKDSDVVKLIISGSDTGFLAESETNLFGLAGETLPSLYNLLDNTIIGKLAGEGIFKTAPIRIQVLNGEGEEAWVDYPVRFDNAMLGSYRTLLFPLKRSLIRNNRLRINTLIYAYTIDYVAVDYSKDEEVFISRSKPDIESLAESDDVRKKMRLGDFVEISFKEPPQNNNRELKRSYFLKTEGYYHPGETEDRQNQGIGEIKIQDAISALKKVKNRAVYARMIYDPAYAEEYLLDYYLNEKMDEQKLGEQNNPETGRKQNRENNNSLYTDFVRITVSTCVVPIDGLKVYSSMNFCANSTFTVTDADKDGRVVEILGSNLVLDCKRSSMDSGKSDNPSRNSKEGVAIGVNQSQNVTIRNCNISRYGIGIGFNYSKDIHIYNNTVEMSYIGIGGDRSNNSVIRNNTVIRSEYVAYGLGGESKNNTIANNKAINITLLAYAFESADNNTMEFNTVNGSASKGSMHLGAIGLTMGANYNTIRNNTIDDVMMGIGMVDVGAFLPGLASYGVSGRFNNFSSNIATNMLVEGIGLLYPYDDDYYNYFDQNNVIEGERVYYYFDVHGNETDYVQINGLNLAAPNTSLFIGKLTFVNCSYINITNNNLSGNFYGLFVIDSHHILISNNTVSNMGDIPGLPLVGTGVPAGIGYLIINSEDVNLSHNNATENFFGYYTKNSLNLTFYNNTATKNSWMGFYINITNSSTFINNTAELNDIAAYSFEYSSFNKIINNTAKDAVALGSSTYKSFRKRGFSFGNTFNNTITDNIVFNCTYGFAMNATNETFANNTITNNSVAGVTFTSCLNRSLINETGNIVENNTGAGYMFADCNNTIVTGLNTTQNNRTGFEIYASSDFTLSNLWSKENNIGFIFNSSRNCTLVDSYSINSTSHELYFYSSKDNRIVNSFLTNNVSGNDVYSATQSWNYLINTSFNRTNFGDDGSNTVNVSVQWYLDLYVIDNESIPVAGANITINDTLGNNYSDNSDIYARARFNLTEYVIKGSSRTYYSNYTWNVTKIGYMANVSMVNMSQNREINVTINLLGGIPDTSPPTNPVVYDGYDYVDYDWTNNATTLLASWSNSTDRHLIFYGYRVLENGTCLAGKCAPTSAGQATQTMITGLTIREGYNYSIGVRARDTMYYYAPFIYSDGIIADLTKPNITANSTTHPNSSQWHSNQNVTFMFYGNDSLSGIAGYSFVLDQNSGTGPDLIEETREDTTLQSMKNTGHGKTLRTNNTGTAFAVFSEVQGNLTASDNITVSVALREDTSDTMDDVSIRAYLLSKDTVITNYDMENLKISNMQTKTMDISSKAFVDADSYSFNLIATHNSTESFYVVITSYILDDNNTYNISIAGTTTDIDNTTASYICEEEGTCTNTTTTFDYAIKVKRKENSTVWHKTYTNLANGEHWFHVRAKDVAGNWGNPAHFKVKIDAINGTPLFTLSKPIGYIATTEPTLVVETNEYTTCYYNTTGIAYTGMTSYDGLHHEKKLTGLSEATYTYSFNCTDRAGNSGYNDTTFIVDLDAVPDDVSIYTMANYTVGKTISVNVNVTKNYNGVPYGLGELADYFSANITNSSGSYKISHSVKDMGNGIYTVSFTAPLKAGDYTLAVAVRGVSDTETFTAASYTLTITYTADDLASPRTKTRLVYSTIGTSYIIGLAGDSGTATTTGSGTSQLQIAGPAVNDNLFIFITRSNAEPGDVAKYIDSARFVDLENPAFGYGTAQEEHVLSTMLEYDDVSIIGTKKVQTGRYTLVIKNEGVNTTTGKTKVSIKII